MSTHTHTHTHTWRGRRVALVATCELFLQVREHLEGVLQPPWSAWGGDREDVALSYVYAYSGPLAVCLVSLFVSVCRSCVSSSSV